jgi:hypothetical protein
MGAPALLRYDRRKQNYLAIITEARATICTRIRSCRETVSRTHDKNIKRAGVLGDMSHIVPSLMMKDLSE